MNEQISTSFSWRLAMERDAPTLTGLVLRAKAHWGYPQQWMDAWQAELTVTSDYILKHRVVVLEENDQLVGFYGVEFRTEVAHLEHLWVEPGRIGSGLGRALFAKACSEASAEGYIALEWVADPHAEGFYRHRGAFVVGEVRGDVLGTTRVLPRMRIDLESANKPW